MEQAIISEQTGRPLDDLPGMSLQQFPYPCSIGKNLKKKSKIPNVNSEFKKKKKFQQDFFRKNNNVSLFFNSV